MHRMTWRANLPGPTVTTVTAAPQLSSDPRTLSSAPITSQRCGIPPVSTNSSAASAATSAGESAGTACSSRRYSPVCSGASCN